MVLSTAQTGESKPGRREANKARTRTALVEALYELLATEPLDQLTAERVADAAGISRRTFFNYFPSVEAVLAHREQEVLDQFRRTLVGRPADESLIDSLNATVSEVFTVELLENAARAWHAIDCSAAATRYALEAGHESLAKLARSWAATRLRPDGPVVGELQLAVLTASCMAAFDTAKRTWLSRHNGPVAAAARDSFIRLVHQAFDYLRPSVDHATERSI